MSRHALMLGLAASASAFCSIADAAPGTTAADIRASLASCEAAMTQAAKAADFTLAKGPCNETLAQLQAVDASGGLSAGERALIEYAFLQTYLTKTSISIKINGKDVPEETCPYLHAAVDHGEAVRLEDLSDDLQLQAQFFLQQAAGSEESCPQEE